MDGELIVWLLFIAIWLISSVIQQIKKISGIKRPDPPAEIPSTPKGQPAATPQARSQGDGAAGDDVLKELMRQLGVDVEPQPAPPPPVPTPAPRSAPPIPGVSRSDASGSPPGLGAGELSTPPYPRAAALGEGAPMPALPRLGLPSGPPARRRRSRSRLAAGVVRDLRRQSGGRSLARAVLLQEILGPPVSLKDAESKSTSAMG
ncbi:MAG: hypothetical protein AAGN66_13665 [Acidobacteriota bacterium]